MSWCAVYAAYALPKMASFAFARYGNRKASALALHRCSRIQYLYNVWKDSGNPAYEFTSSDVANCKVREKSPLDLLAGREKRDPFFDRLEAMEKIAPKWLGGCGSGARSSKG